ncbi:hypothetical protein SMACR_05062 [Sordaria macrospora]|uniref:Uncharacterized protein n=1 Tax=Sordaria macrospora TaxID=5147 RepID=A0A8S8ZVH2_SORMA|nr:hypothetical protein SMACR_05062 [Sordaria macrospora]
MMMGSPWSIISFHQYQTQAPEHNHLLRLYIHLKNNRQVITNKTSPTKPTPKCSSRPLSSPSSPSSRPPPSPAHPPPKSTSASPVKSPSAAHASRPAPSAAASPVSPAPTRTRSALTTRAMTATRRTEAPTAVASASSRCSAVDLPVFRAPRG